MEIAQSHKDAVARLTAEVEHLEALIDKAIGSCPDLAGKNRRLLTLPGVGPVTATSLLALVPELGLNWAH